MNANRGRVAFSVMVSLGLVAGALAALGAWGGGPPAALAQGPDGQAVYYVALDCTGMPSPCYTSVQAAVDAADAADDVIKVAVGLYTGVSARDGVTQVVYLDKTVTIQGGYTVTNWTTPDPAAYPTVLSALGLGRVLYILGDITPTIAGLRLAGGSAMGLGGYVDPDTLAEHDGGGGVYAAYATPTITNCQIDSSGAEAGGGIALFESPLRLYNSAVLTNQAGYGGGLALGRSDAVLDGNTIAANQAGYGGGLGVGQSAAQITNNTIRANSAVSSGGGVALIGNPPATLRGNLITDNDARWGGGLVISSSTAHVLSNTIRANHATEVGGGVNLDHCDAQVVGNLVQANTSDYSGAGFYLVASTAVLTGNRVLSNTAGESGGGLYLNESQPWLYGNTIHANTAQDTGGGMGLRYSAAQVVSNTISANACFGVNWNEAGGGGVHVRASDGARFDGNAIVQNSAIYYGGGVYLRESAAELAANLIATNTVDTQDSWNGGGGGIYLDNSDGAILTGNTIAANLAAGSGSAYGGGVFLNDSQAALTDNQVLSNTLQSSTDQTTQGGGLYLDGSRATLVRNTIAGNRVANGVAWGGGLFAQGEPPTLIENVFSANLADWDGGGAFFDSVPATLRGNHFISNTASTYGGGVYFNRCHGTVDGNTFMSNTASYGSGLTVGQDDTSLVINNVFAANDAQAGCGGALYLRGAAPRVMHNTLVANRGTSAVCASDAYGSGSRLTMTNTIVASHTVGVDIVGSSSQAVMTRTLWYSNTTDWTGTGNDNEPLSGDPAFANAAAHDYHIGPASTALDQGADSGVLDDIDGEPRPADGGYDVGADERPGAALRIAKSAAPLAVNPGESILYTVIISSAGTAAANSVALTDTLPALARVQGVAASQGACTHGAGWGGTVTCGLGTLAAGARAVVTLTVETTTTPAVLPARLRNVAQARAAETLTMTAEADAWLHNCHARLNDTLTDYSTVQAAVDAAEQPGDLVKVAGACVGVNTQGGLRQQVYLVKTLTIRGGYTAGDWASSDPAAHPTVLDALGLGRVVYIAGAVSPTLEGLTLQNGDATGLAGYTHPLGGWTEDAGGGVASVGASALLTSCRVYSGTASYGGGVFASGGAARIADNTLAGNRGSLGGGLHLANDLAMATNNVIDDNTASSGGGVYLNNSTAQLAGNSITANTAWSGGGVYISEGAPTLSLNSITTNTARGGAGLYAIADYAVITANTIASNTASGNDGGGLYHNNSHGLVSNNTIADNVTESSGGGSYLTNSEAQYSGNTFSNNTASNGGGAYVEGDYYGGGPTTFIANTFSGNAALYDGGGLRLVMGTNVISGNLMISNTAGNEGGGAYLQSMILNNVPLLVQVINNRVLSNTAQQDGGGFYVLGPRPYLRNNVLLGNTANDDGGGLYVAYRSYEPFVNTVIADNRAGSEGGGLYIAGASPQLLHTTLARNASGGGQAVYLESYYSGGWNYSHPTFTNTILADSPTGIYVNADNGATLNGVLWYSLTTPSEVYGSITVTHEISDEAAFESDGYHLSSLSAARDRGVESGVAQDLDGQMRPMGFGFDLGADEYAAPALLLDKQASANAVDAGAAVTYTLVANAAGSGTVHHVTLTDTLDAAQQVVGATATQGGCASTPGWGGRAVCAIGDVPAGAIVTVTLVAQVAPTATLGGQALDQAAARGDEAGASAQAVVYMQSCRARINDGTATYPSIQAAVDAAGPGDLIKVAGGVCLGAAERAGARQHVYISKTVTLRGGYDAGDWTSYDWEARPTKLDALGGGRVAYIAGNAAPVLEGFSLTGGDAGANSGGGVYVDGAAAVLRHNRVYANRAGNSGGGVYVYDSAAVIERCEIYSNTTAYNGGGVYLNDSDTAQVNHNQIFANTCTAWSGSGGGVYLSYSDAALSGNVIFSNTVTQDGGGVYSQRSHAVLSRGLIYANAAGRDGGGVYLGMTSVPRLTNVVIADNRADRNGAGVYNSNALPRIVHATIARNTGGDASGVYVASGTSVQLTNTLIVSQATGVLAASGTAAGVYGVLWYSNTANTAGSVAVTEEITGNPAFAADGAEAAHPYHILESSWAIDRGLNAGVTEDVDGQMRPMDTGYDLGADEYPGVGLAVSKHAPSLYVIYDRPLTYTIVVTSAGTQAATGVVLTDTLDTWQQISSVAASQGTCSPTAGWGGGAVCTIGDLPSGVTVYVTLAVQMSPAITLGQAMLNSVDVTADETANGAHITVHATDCRARVNDGAAEYTLLQDAVDAAAAGDLVKVAGGTCVGLNTRGGLGQVLYLDKQVTIRGGYADDWTSSDPEANPTTLDAQKGGRVLYVTGSVSPTLEGLRFTGGDAGSLGGANWSGSGGGACVRTASPTFVNTHFLDNAATRGAGLFLESSGALVQASHFYSNAASLRGGGVYAYQGAPSFDANAFYANTASSTGGGVYLFGSDAVFDANRITANSSDQGGGIYLDTAAAPRFYNTVLAGNRASGMAGALYASASSPRLWHTTIAGNVYTNSVGVYVTDWSGTASSVAMTNTILVSQSVGIQVNAGSAAALNGVLWFNNSGGNAAGPVTVQNAVTGDPAFAADGAEALHPYHLTAASQAIDRGVDSGVSTDIDGDARPQDGGYELGADEYRGTVILDVSGPGVYLLSDQCSRLTFAPGQTGTLRTITATFVYTYPTAQAAPRPLPRRYDIQGDGTGFTATLSLCYADADLVAASIPMTDESGLLIYRYTGGGRWISHTTSVHTPTNVVSAVVTGFSTWAIGVPAGGHEPTAVGLYAQTAPGARYPYMPVGLLLGAGLLGLGAWRARWRRRA